MRFQGNQKTFTRIFFAVLVGFFTALYIFISFFQRNFFSKTYLFITILSFLVFSFTACFLNPFVARQFASYRRKEQTLAFMVSLVLGIMILINVPLRPLYALLPGMEVEIKPAPMTPAGGGQPVRLLFIKNDLGYLPPARIQLEGVIDSEEGLALIPASGDFSIAFKGVMGEKLQIGFSPAENARMISIAVNGEEELLNLHRPEAAFDVVFEREFSIPVYFRLPFFLSSLALFTYGFLCLIVSLSALRIASDHEPSKNIPAFIFCLPFVVTALTNLFVFWPGIMSRDSISQWEQVVSGRYSQWFSMTHSLAIKVITWVWSSPAAVALAQIALLAFAFTQGFRLLRALKAPFAALAAVSLLAAAIPQIPLFAVTLWRDTVYSACLLALFIFTVWILTSNGEWLDRRGNWLLLGIFAFLSAAIRSNGIPAAALSLGVLFFIAGRRRKKIVFSFLLAVSLFGVFEIGLGKALADESGSRGQAGIILLPHLAAHLSSGTELQAAERNYLSSLLPLEEWEYDCCYIGGISYHPGFDRRLFLGSFTQNLGLALKLFARDPLVDIRHQACAGEMIWRLSPGRCSQKSAHGFSSLPPGVISWIEDNASSISEDSKLPGLVAPWMAWLDRFSLFDDQVSFILRPALYLTLLILGFTVFALRRRQISLMAGLAAPLAHALVLLLINFSPALRYQFPVMLSGLFALGLAFIPKQGPGKTKTKGVN